MSESNSRSFKEIALGEPGSKKRVNSKVKGNKNEVEVAKAISKWTGVPFRRTPASGAIHVPLHWLSGDIFCAMDNFKFPFSVETKHYKKVSPKLVEKWWKQTCVDAERVNKIPMLIYRANGWPKKEWCIHILIDGLVGAYHSSVLFATDYNEFIKTIS